MRQRLPTVLQAESGECGLACLAAVIRFHGGGQDLNGLRQLSPASSRGMTLKQLMAVANGAGFNTRALRLEPEELPGLKTPAVLHWDQGHFVVLAGSRGKLYQVMDPALGRRSLNARELSRHFTGVALELDPATTLDARRQAPGLKLRALVRQTRGLTRALGHTLAMAVCLQLLALLGPVATQWVLDRAIPTADRPLLQLIVLATAALGALTLAFQAARGWLLARIAAQVRQAWSGSLFSRLLRLPAHYHRRRTLGGSLSRYDSMRAIQELLTETTPEVLLDGLLACTTLVLMVLYAPALALCCAFTWLIYALLRAAMFPAQRDHHARLLVRSAAERSCLLETLRNCATWKQRASTALCCGRYLNLLSAETNAGTGLRLFTMRCALLRNGLGQAERALVLWLGASAVIAGELTIGMLVAFLSYKQQFSARVADLVDRAFELGSLGLHRERIGDITALDPEPVDTGAGEPGSAPHGIRLEAAAFRYSDSEPWLFRNLHLRLGPGDWLALHANSGTGKSTLLCILGGLLEPVEGGLFCNGRSVRGWMDAYRGSLGVVHQGDGLLGGSLLENIAFFDPRPDRRRIEEVSRLAGLHEQVCAWPSGYATRVGELDHGLSGGQVQRVLIARALYHRPRLLLLDEAFSQLDEASESRICAGIKSLGITCLAVTHRSTSFRYANEVLSLQGPQPARIRRFRPR